MVHERDPHFTLCNVGPQQLHVAFDGGRSSPMPACSPSAPWKAPARHRRPGPTAARPTLPQVHRPLRRGPPHPGGLPDPGRLPRLQRRPATCATDPLFQILADVTPDAEQPLASPSTLARFPVRLHPPPGRTAPRGTARPAGGPCRPDRPPEDPQRLPGRPLHPHAATPPAEVILDVDATDDPVHGHQALSGYHGYYRQHQYLPLFVYDGATRLPPGRLAAARARSTPAWGPSTSSARIVTPTAGRLARRAASGALRQRPGGAGRVRLLRGRNACPTPSATPPTPCCSGPPTSADLEPRSWSDCVSWLGA